MCALPIWWSFHCRTAVRLHGLLASPLRRHVGCLKYCDDERGTLVALSTNELLLISERMAHLEELDCMIRLTPGMPTPHWPARLTKLQLRLQLATEVAEEVAALMSLVGQSLARHPSLVEEFGVRCYDQNAYYHPIPGDLLSPLRQGPLKKLTCRGEISSSAYPILRRMSHLTSLDLSSHEQLVELMAADGPVPPLERIDAANYLEVTEEFVPLLVKIPTLRSLDLNFLLADPTPLVPVLRRLHTLTVFRDPTCDLDLFLSALQQATQLTDLTLFDQLTESHLAALLPPMRQLKRLGVWSRSLRSLDFLSAASHLSSTLTRLALHSCQLDPAHVRYLRPLRSLVELDLDRCFTPWLDGDTVATMTPGDDGFLKEVWPRLQRVAYR